MTKHNLGEFFDENYMRFKRYLRVRFSELNDYDIEDIIQQTVVRFLYKGEDILSVNNLAGYFYTSLQNGAKDHFKHGSRKDIREDDSRYMELPSQALEEEVLANELNRAIKKALYSLDEKSRYLFIETEIKGRSYESIMAETGEKLGTLLSRKNRAKVKLQQVLEQYRGR